MSNFWDDRYSKEEYIYGTMPNAFFAQELRKLKPGSIILPCDGEGRNGVFAAGVGWQVYAFDASTAGRDKAMALAANRNVTINYLVADAGEVAYAEDSADAVALIYTHFPPGAREQLYNNVIKWLKPGGTLIVEVFSIHQLHNTSGGPKDIDLLVTEDILMQGLAGLQCSMLTTAQIMLDEGPYHSGLADVVRFTGTKPL